MIEGVVNVAYKPVVTLSLIGPGGEIREIDFVVDTGFNRFLTLPSSVVADLGLTEPDSGQLRLVGGRVAKLDVYDVTVGWMGGVRSVQAYESENFPLLGTALLAGHRLSVDFRIGGPVLIEA